MKPDIQCVRTHWIRGFMAFLRGRAARGAGQPVVRRR